MMEMGRELLGELYGKPFDLRYAKNMKIPAVVDPREVSELSVELSHQDGGNGTVEVKYSISGGGTVFFKFAGNFRG